MRFWFQSEEASDQKDSGVECFLNAVQAARQEKQEKEAWMKVHLVLKRVCAIGLLFYCANEAAQFPAVGS